MICFYKFYIEINPIQFCKPCLAKVYRNKPLLVSYSYNHIRNYHSRETYNVGLHVQENTLSMYTQFNLKNLNFSFSYFCHDGCNSFLIRHTYVHVPVMYMYVILYLYGGLGRREGGGYTRARTCVPFTMKDCNHDIFWYKLL